MKKMALLVAGIWITQASTAQISVTGSTLTYTQDFNTLSNASTASSAVPTGWQIFEYGSGAAVDQMYVGNDGGNNAGNTYSYGAAASTERALGSIASGGLLTHYGAVFTNNTSTQITGFTISYTGEQWRLGNNLLHSDSLRFLYSTTATGVSDTNAVWTEVPALMLNSIVTSGTAAGAINGNANNVIITGTVNVGVANGGDLIIKWIDKNIAAADDGLAVDDLSITFTTSTPPPPNYQPVITMLSPADNSSSVAPGTSLMIAFDRIVSKGSGSISVKNETDQTTQTINVTSSGITLNGGSSGDTVTVSGVTLALAKLYHVVFDSTAFDTAGYHSAGIYDSTEWNFATTVPVPPPAASLNEQFDSACNAGVLPAGWSKQDVTGSAQQWICAGTTGADRYMQMNGFSGTSNDNEDWLITPELDLSAALNPMLRFKAYKGFTGDDIDVLTSSNYAGGNPNTAAWSSLGISFSSATSTWADYAAALNGIQAQPFHIAFKYACTQAANNCAQWRVDSVLVSGTLGLLAVKQNNRLPVYVLGNAGSNSIPVGFTLARTGTVVATIYDMTGREVYRTGMSATAGLNRFTLTPSSLPGGIYIIHLANGAEYGVAKVVIE